MLRHTKEWWMTYLRLWSNVFNIFFITLALTNWTIGPSSDTTWFPTWIKGTLPVEGGKKMYENTFSKLIQK